MSDIALLSNSALSYNGINALDRDFQYTYSANNIRLVELNCPRVLPVMDIDASGKILHSCS
jgi:hypothetical protein